MRIDEARERAGDWVRHTGMRTYPGLVGAFFSGSTIEADPAAELAPDSDVDVLLVVDGEPPDKLGKIIVDGLALDVGYLARYEITDPDRVARTFYLAPSFRRNMIIFDPGGELGRVHDHVRRVFAHPDLVRARYCDVLHRMDERVAAVGRARPWSERVLLWVFAASLPTQVLLVAGLRNPTVRLRYLRARELLDAAGRPEAYEELLTQLGAGGLSAAAVRQQLARLPAVFDAAAQQNRGDLVTAMDIGPAGRDVAFAGSERLVRAGDHREAVFWLVVTYARCLLILDRHDPEIADRHRPTVLEAVAVLTGLDGDADLAERTAVLARARPGLVATAEELLGRSALTSGP